MATCGIYRIVNKTNGKFYIGSSDNIERRFSRHLLDLKKNRHDNQHLQHSWNKYGKSEFTFEIIRICVRENLLLEEQKELNIWVGKEKCYNMRKDAICPVAPGEKRSEETKRKISVALKGKPLWTEEQKKQMSINRTGRKHSNETKKRMKGRTSSYENISKAQCSNIGRIYSPEHCLHISDGKQLNQKVFSDKEKLHIKNGVRKAILEGRYHKNKVPKEEYDNIKNMYLYGTINKRQLAFKYGINPSSMQKLLQRIGV